MKVGTLVGEGARWVPQVRFYNLSTLVRLYGMCVSTFSYGCIEPASTFYDRASGTRILSVLCYRAV